MSGNVRKTVRETTLLAMQLCEINKAATKKRGWMEKVEGYTLKNDKEEESQAHFNQSPLRMSHLQSIPLSLHFPSLKY